MVAEQILRDPALFSRLPGAHPCLEKEALRGKLPVLGGNSAAAPSPCLIGPKRSEVMARYIGFVLGSPLVLEDGSVFGKHGAMLRPEVKAARDMRQFQEFERQSVWWTNVDVVKGHLKQLLGDSGGGGLVSRGTFKRAATVRALIECYQKRFPAGVISEETSPTQRGGVLNEEVA